jgi:hypothetical protein
MVVDQDVWGSSNRGTVLFLWDVEMSVGVPVPLCETTIDDIDLMIVLVCTHQEVGGFDVAVDEMTRVDILNM